MNLPNITKFPILVISTPRSGSSVLTRFIGDKYNLKVFQEPHTSSSIYNQFIEYAKENNDYIIKIHSRDVSKYPKLCLQELYSDSSFKINIIRQNRVNQIASAIIAHTRNVWVYRENSDSVIHEEFKFNEDFIDLNINYLKQCYKQTTDLQIDFDLVVEYENLGYIKHPMHIKTPLPCNYEELLFAIRKRIQNVR